MVLHERTWNQLRLKHWFPEPGPVLVMVEGDRACAQLRGIMSNCDLTVVKPEEYDESFHSQASQQRKRAKKNKARKRRSLVNDREDEEDLGNRNPSQSQDQQSATPSDFDSPEFSSPGVEQLLNRLLQRYFRWKGGMSAVTRNLFKRPNTSVGNGSSNHSDGGCSM